MITHGEPHPGNVIRLPGRHPARGEAGQAGARLALIDWDTVGLAPPERDLWMVATESGDEVRRYAELTGRPVDPAVLEFYRLRWALDDLSCFVRDLRAPHRRTPGAEDNWAGLQTTIADPPRPLTPGPLTAAGPAISGVTEATAHTGPGLDGRPKG